MLNNDLKFYSGKNILVTGGAGAVGANLVRALCDLEVNQIYVVDNLSSGFKSNLEGVPRTIFIEGDIADPRTLDEVFTHGIDVVFHLAAFFANQNSIDHPHEDARTNILGTLQVLEYSNKNKVELFVYVNTPCMYNAESSNWTEGSKEIKHETPYSISKFTGEQYSKFFYKYHKLPTVSARIFNSYGPYEHPGRYRNVIPNFIDTATKGQSLTITGTGTETRSFTFVDDIVRGLLLAGTQYDGSWQIYNIGSAKETKIIDLAKKINELTGNTAPIVFTSRRDWDNTLRRRPNINRAKKRLGYHPTVKLEDGLKRTLDWFRERKEI